MVLKGKLKRIILIAAAVIAAALVLLHIKTIISFCAYVIWLFIPFAAAYLVSLLVDPMADALGKRFRLPRGISAVLVIVLTVGVIGVVISGTVWKIVDEIKGLYEDFPTIYAEFRMTWTNISIKLSGLWENMPDILRNTANELYLQLTDSVSKLATQTEFVDRAGNFAKKLPSVFISIIVFVISLYFMVSDSETVDKAVKKPFKKEFIEKLSNLKIEFKRYIGGYVRAQLIIMCIAFVILMTGFSIMGIKYALIIAIATAAVDALPFFGSGTVLIPWSLASFLTGNFSTGVHLIIIYLTVLLMRQFVEPKLVSKNIGMHPILTLMSMYIGYRVLSIGGMILGPLVLMTLVSLYKAGFFEEPIKFVKNTSLKIKREFDNIKKYIDNEGE